MDVLPVAEFIRNLPKYLKSSGKEILIVNARTLKIVGKIKVESAPSVFRAERKYTQEYHR